MSNLIVKNGQTIFDIALIAYGDPSQVYELIARNNIDGINANIDGLNLVYEYKKPPQKETVKINIVTQKVVTIKSTQTLFDVALQLYGSAESVFELMELNPLIDNLTDESITGLNVNYVTQRTALPIFFDKEKIVIATRFPSMEEYRVTDLYENRLTDDNYLRKI